MSHLRANAVLAGTLAVLAPSPARSQNNEPIYRSWYWEETSSTPRVAGMGGAYVGLADDASSVFLNPAGLMTLPRPGDLQVTRTMRPAHDIDRTGDKLTAHRGFEGTVGLRLSPRLGIGVAVARPKADQTFIGVACRAGDQATDKPSLCSNDPGAGAYACALLDDGTCDLASMNVAVKTFVFAAAYQPWSFPLSLGVSVGWQSIRADGLSNRCDQAATRERNGCIHAPTMPHMHDYATRGRLWNIWGVRYQAGKLALGASFRLPVHFAFTRAEATTGPFIPGAAAGPAPPQYVMTVPARASLGSSWHQDFLNTRGRFLASVEVDHVQYGQIAKSFTIEPGTEDFPHDDTHPNWLDPRTQYNATDYHLDNAFEFRAGVELTLRSLLKSNKLLRKLGLQARGGFYRPARSSLRYSAPPDQTSLEAGVFVGPEPDHEWSWGASLNFSLFRFEYTRVYGGYRPASLMGVSVRYPGFF